jgi:hypothetical protein
MKKQLVSQERAAAKKASLEPLLPGLSGKKFAASTLTTPSEDLVHPMLDMSIGEAVVPSGRRPQFTQERSATKKVPLQARGCENFITMSYTPYLQMTRAPPPSNPEVAELLRMIMEDREAARAERQANLATLQQLTQMAMNHNGNGNGQGEV